MYKPKRSNVSMDIADSKASLSCTGMLIGYQTILQNIFVENYPLNCS